MNTDPLEANVSISLSDLEALIHRAVRETLRDELVRLLRSPTSTVLEEWLHEGPDDPVGDEQLLAEALTLIQQYDENAEGWKTLEDFEAELARDETACELSG